MPANAKVLPVATSPNSEGKECLQGDNVAPGPPRTTSAAVETSAQHTLGHDGDLPERIRVHRHHAEAKPPSPPQEPVILTPPQEPVIVSLPLMKAMPKRPPSSRPRGIRPRRVRPSVQRRPYYRMAPVYLRVIEMQERLMNTLRMAAEVLQKIARIFQRLEELLPIIAQAVLGMATN